MKITLSYLPMFFTNYVQHPKACERPGNVRGRNNGQIGGWLGVKLGLVLRNLFDSLFTRGYYFSLYLQRSDYFLVFKQSDFQLSAPLLLFFMSKLCYCVSSISDLKL